MKEKESNCLQRIIVKLFPKPSGSDHYWLSLGAYQQQQETARNGYKSENSSMDIVLK